MALRTRILTPQDLKAVEKNLWGSLPPNPSFEDFRDNRRLLLLSEVSKHFGINAFVIRRYACAKEGRFKDMGISIIGKKFYVNTFLFSEWALTHKPTRKRITLNFLENVSELPLEGQLNDVIQSGKHYLLDDLCAANLLPKPFCSKNGKQALYELSRESKNPQEEMGLYYQSTFKTWLVDPMFFFSYIGHRFALLETYS